MSRLGNRRAYRAITHAARRVKEQTGQPPALNVVGGLASHGSQAPESHMGRRTRGPGTHGGLGPPPRGRGGPDPPAGLSTEASPRVWPSGGALHGST